MQPLRLDSSTGGSLTSRGMLGAAGLAIQGALRFATSWLVGHLGGKAALGVVQGAISTATLLALLWPTTAGAAASKYIARARGAGNQAEVQAVAAHLRRRSTVAGLIVGLAAVPAWVFIDQGALVDSLWVAVFAMAYSGYSFARGVQYGAGQVQRATLWDALSAFLGLLALLLALVAGVRGTLLLLPLALSYAVYTFAGWPRGVSGTPDRALRREIDHIILVGVAGTLASTGFLQLAMIVAKGTGGDAEAGQFAAAMVTATPASMLASSLSLVLFPTLSEAWGRGDRETFRTQTDNATRALVLVMVTIFGSLILCSRLVMQVLWGDEFQSSSTIFPVLVSAILATNMAVATVNALATRSQRGLQLSSAASFAGLLLGALLWWRLTPELGVLGVALGYLAGSVLSAATPMAAEWRIGGHRWRSLWLRLAVGLAVLGALFAAQRSLGLPPVTDPLMALAFCAVWWLLSRSDLRLLPLRHLRGRP